MNELIQKYIEEKRTILFMDPAGEIIASLDTSAVNPKKLMFVAQGKDSYNIYYEGILIFFSSFKVI